jgi:predicted amino acid-binding ACT domain protein
MGKEDFKVVSVTEDIAPKNMEDIYRDIVTVFKVWECDIPTVSATLNHTLMRFAYMVDISPEDFDTTLEVLKKAYRINEKLWRELDSQK